MQQQWRILIRQTDARYQQREHTRGKSQHLRFLPQPSNRAQSYSLIVQDETGQQTFFRRNGFVIRRCRDNALTQLS